MTLPITYYDPALAQWPDLLRGAVPLAPVRVGVDRRTGLMLVGWPHVMQSMQAIFSTGFHERILRRWVGSFVPHILGESAVPRIVTRFFWAIASALDLWEPCYAIKQVLVTDDTTAEQVRSGQMGFQVIGTYMPRGHLGDFTPEGRKTGGWIGTGNRVWKPQ